ncbi:MAG: alkaline phosphatase family protein [Candidatus Helarchaeota archaeon]
MEIYKKISSDLFFITFLSLDRIQHFLWRFMDQNDPTFPGNNCFENSIKEFYELFDKIIGEFMKIIESEVFLIVLSDHGHGRRCTKCLNLNEFLRKKNYLFLKNSGIAGINTSIKKLVEKMKVFSLRNFHKLGFQDLAYKIAKFVPNKKSLRKASYLIDKEKSLAYASEFCSTNPFGGIEVNKNDKYEELRNNLIEELDNLNEYLNEDIIRWVKRREELYQGEYLDKYPDIVFELNEEYGINWDLFTSLISENYTHRKISGGHKKEGTLAIWPKIKKIEIEIPTSVIAIKDFILKLLAN